MTQFSANLSMLFTEVPFLQRLEAAAKAGFRHVEFQFPYEHGAAEIGAEIAAHNLKLLMFNLPPGNWAAGERGFACHPNRQAEFRNGVALALSYAQELGVKKLNCLAGIKPADASTAQCHTVLLQNLSDAATALAEAGVQLMIEPINSYDMPGFFIDTPQGAIDIIKELQHPNLALQYDIYHAQQMNCDIALELRQFLPHIQHIQFADCPGRHEPGTGTLNLKMLFALLANLGYDAPLSAEYVPLSSTVEGLGWLQQFPQDNGS